MLISGGFRRDNSIGIESKAELVFMSIPESESSAGPASESRPGPAPESRPEPAPESRPGPKSGIRPRGAELRIIIRTLVVAHMRRIAILTTANVETNKNSKQKTSIITGRYIDNRDVLPRTKLPEVKVSRYGVEDCMAPVYGGLRRRKRFVWDQIPSQVIGALAPSRGQADSDTVEDMDTGVEGDRESIADEKRDKTSGKRKQKTTPQLKGKLLIRRYWRAMAAKSRQTGLKSNRRRRKEGSTESNF
ncbi:hypothetical protein EVAR_61415_1 [Eumeta japonica]|uniref:Uncharacterized protein n=1 Tax=Eumeta variegata TaxID=151549 RepID=A0A4C1YYF5_EUMVA|nr:hypothetical protein EVAR_61415_1 [Eumeta japonica]